VVSIIKNLLDNACKYTKTWGTITITLDDKKLEIKDTGIGIDQKALPHIWERFWRADESRSEWSWFWLWLYLVHKFVHVHGRNIIVESKLKKGSTFTINFS
jgi:signal transduction histidine kinase